jgi:hypothetical protein
MMNIEHIGLSGKRWWDQRKADSDSGISMHLIWQCYWDKYGDRSRQQIPSAAESWKQNILRTWTFLM